MPRRTFFRNLEQTAHFRLGHGVWNHKHPGDSSCSGRPLVPEWTSCKHPAVCRDLAPGWQRRWLLGLFEEEEEEDRYSQRRSQGGGWGSGHPRLSKGGQGEVVRRRFSIVGTFSLGSLVKRPRNRSLIPQYRFHKTKQLKKYRGSRGVPRDVLILVYRSLFCLSSIMQYFIVKISVCYIVTDSHDSMILFHGLKNMWCDFIK